MTMKCSNFERLAILCGAWAVICPAFALAQSTSDEPPPIRRGGIVQQLRSLSQEALGAFDSGESRSLSRSSNAPSRAAGQAHRSRGLLAPNEPDDDFAEQMQSAPLLERFSHALGRSPAQEPPVETQVFQQQPLAEVVTPDQILGRRTTSSQAVPHPAGNPNRDVNPVHVEESIPENVRASIRRGTTPGGNRGQGYGSSALDQPQAPQVSRIPLPGSGGNRLADVLESTPTRSASPAPARQLAASPHSLRSSRSDEIETTPATLESEIRAVSSLRERQSEQVSVPAKLIDGPTSERRPESRLPAIIDSQTDLPASVPSGMPQLPDLHSPETAPAPIQAPKTALPYVALPQNALPQNALPAALPSLRNPPTLATASLRDSSSSLRDTPSSLRDTQVTPSYSPASNQRMRMQTPRIEVILNGPSDLPVGVAAKYEVVVRNTDHIDLNGLVLRLDVPAGVAVQATQPTEGEFDVERTGDGATLLTWSVDYLKAQADAVAGLQLVASTPKNFAIAMDWTLVPLSAESEVEVLAPRLELALEGPAEVRFGEPNVYRLHVRNPGNAVAAGIAVELSAEPYGASSAKIGDIAAGSEETIDVELTFNQRGAIRIAALASAAGNLSSDTSIEVLVKQPELATSIVAPELVYHGSATHYQVQVSNKGDTEAREIEAVFEMPPQAKVVSMPTEARVQGTRITWPIASLPVGETLSYNLQLNLPGEGENTARFQCTDSCGSKAQSQGLTFVESIADLKLFVSDPVAPAPVGGEVLYELSLTNRGSKSASNVNVVAQFSEGIEPTRGEGQKYRVVPGQLVFEPISVIQAGETIKLRVFAEAANGGMHRFRAEVLSDESEVRLVQEESTQFISQIRRVATPLGGNVIR